MRLKKLTILGFKSFADKIVLDFEGQIIGIVGPNGCGKSNIVDAVRWVIGEPTARSMRAEKMQDLLFAGAASRKPINVAEVSLTLSETAGFLPIDYDEITITRRIHRSGESEYWINKNPVRLKDIQDLLLGSGVGKNAFSVFEQGKLDQIIYVSPLERRGIFDECAGIGRFLLRKKETLKKLDEMMGNYQRIHDLHGEVLRQTRLLEKQAHQAKSYQTHKERLEKLEKGALAARWQRSSQKENVLLEEIKKLEEKSAHQNASLESIEQKKEEEKKKSEAFQNEFQAIQKAHYETQTLLQLKESENESLKKQGQKVRDQEKKIQDEKKQLQEIQSGSAIARREKEQKLDALSKREQSLKKEVGIARASKEDLEEKASHLRGQQKELEKERIQALQEENRLSSLLQENQLRLESCERELQKMLKAQSEREKKLEKDRVASQEKREKLQALSQIIDEAKERISSSKKQGKIHETLIEQKREEGADLQRLLAEMQARETVLKGLRQDFSEASKRLLEEAKNPKSALFGKVFAFFEFFHPKEGFERILSIALHLYTETLVVKTFKDREDVLKFAKKANLQNYSLFCLEALPKSIKNDKKVLALFEEGSHLPCAHHFFKEISVVKDIEGTTQPLSLTEAGHFFDHNKVLFHVGLEKEESHVFLREAELKAIANKLKKLQEKKEQLELDLKVLIEEKSSRFKREAEEEGKMRRKEMELIEVNFALQQFLSEIESGEKELKKQMEEQKRLNQARENYAKKGAPLTDDVKAAQERRGKCVRSAQMHEKELDEKLTTLKEISKSHQEVENAYQKIVSEWLALKQELAILEIKEEQALVQEGKIEQNRIALLEALEELKVREAALKKESEELRERGGKFADQYRLFEEKMAELKRETTRLEKEWQRAVESYHQSESKKNRLSLALEEERVLKSGWERELQERFHCSVDEISQDGEAEFIEKEIAKLRVELERAGAINLAAIEEFEQQKERSSFLEKQLGDLEQTKNELEGLLTTLEAQSRKQFKVTFDRICENFKKNFQILFQGGEADLRFTESPDILEAGVEIVAKPPGKQMRCISLLSGGEKCLTALALLFSIFEEKPAPFCILDEVDAPLDDANIDRFTEVLKKFIDKTQFLIVTHNKKTMAIANLLFGVSMEEKGISKLISLQFEKSKETVGIEK